MRDLTLALSASNKKKFNTLSPQSLNIALLAGIILLTLTYLFTVTSMGTKSFEIKKLELQLRALQEEQKQLQIQSADMQSIERIQLQAARMNFVPSTNVTYLQDTDFALK